MAYVQVPKDLTKVKTKVMLNMTKRQLICFSMAAAVGLPLYFLTRERLGTTASAYLMIIVVLPFFLFAMYEKNGRPLEQTLKIIWQARVQRPGIRIYRTENFYAAIQQEIYEKEVLGVGEEKTSTAGKKKKGGSPRTKSKGRR